MKETDNLKLKLPEESDWADVESLNENFRTLDQTVGATGAAVEGKADKNHTHTSADITGLDDAMSDALAGKAEKDHTHTVSQITDFPSSMPASDVYSWAKQASKPTYTASEVGAAASSHTHTVSQISGTLPVSKGGTGQTSLSALMTAMGAGKIVTGKYTGDGNASMTINLGFTPKAVLLYARDRNSLFDSYYGVNPSNTDDNKSTLCLQGETIVCEANNVISVSGNSFTVYYLSSSNKYGTSVFIYANVSGETFNYIAFG